MAKYTKFQVSFYDCNDALDAFFVVSAPSTHSKVFHRKLADAMTEANYTLPAAPANAVKFAMPGEEPTPMLWQAMLSPWVCCDLEDGTKMVPVYRRSISVIEE